MDYRELNSHTNNSAFLKSHLIDAIESLRGARCFSIVDLAQVYFQFPVAKEDQPKTAFRTGISLWEYVRMPFDLKEAPDPF